MADIEDTRAIVSANETYEGKLIPTRRAEINRPVTIHENATVTEGIYGQEVTISEEATVDGPVMAQESVKLTGGTVTADIGTAGKVTGEKGTIFGTVTATKVTLENCIVYGNVVSDDVILEECLVFGVVIGERNMELRDTICYTFKSFGEGIFDQVEIVLPQAVVDGPVALETPVSVLAIPDELLDDERDGDSQLTQHDLAKHEDTQYLTLAPRLLRLTAVRDQIEAIEELFTEVVVSLKMTDGDDRPEHNREWFKKKLRNIEE